MTHVPVLSQEKPVSQLPRAPTTHTAATVAYTEAAVPGTHSLRHLASPHVCTALRANELGHSSTALLAAHPPFIVQRPGAFSSNLVIRHKHKCQTQQQQTMYTSGNRYFSQILPFQPATTSVHCSGVVQLTLAQPPVIEHENSHDA